MMSMAVQNSTDGGIDEGTGRSSNLSLNGMGREYLNVRSKCLSLGHGPSAGKPLRQEPDGR